MQAKMIDPSLLFLWRQRLFVTNPRTSA